MNSIQKEIFKSIDIITDKKIEDIQLDKTIIAKITAHPTPSQNLYRIQYQGLTYDAFSSTNESYTVSDSVLVLVPSNQFSNKKIILMKEPRVAEALTTASGGGASVAGVTQVSVVSANGFAGTVANSTSTASITLTTTVNGILQGNGTAISAASTTGTGSVVLSGNPTMSTASFTGQIVSTVTTGTAPLAVASTTKVTNLNSDLLDDQTGTYYLDYNNFTNTPTIGNGLLTLDTFGLGLSGSTTFSANTTSPSTFTVTSNATSSNVASTIIARSANGTFSATDMLLSGQGIFSSGGLGTPSITFLNDTNTGLYNPAADTIGFVEGGAEAMRVDSGGRLLIGTTASFTGVTSNTNTLPRLQIAGTTLSTACMGLNRFTNDTVGFRAVFTKSRSSNVGGHTIVVSGDELGAISFGGSDGTQSREAARISVAVDGTPGDGDMPGRIVFFTSTDSGASPTEKMRIDNAGSLGIGTSGPLSKLHVNANSGTPGYTIVTSANLITTGADSSANAVELDSFAGTNQIIARRANTGLASPTAVGGNTNMLQIGSRAYNGTAYPTTDSARIAFQTNGAHTTTASGASITFFNTTTGTTSIVEAMRIHGPQELLIGYTTSNSTSTSFKLQVNSQIFATSGTIATSDGNYKQNIEPLTDSLDIINALNPISFNWKPHPVHNFDLNTRTVGFIAQEVQEVLKNKLYVNSIIKQNQSIYQDENGNEIIEPFLGIAEGNLIAILTRAIQEQQQQINDLKNEINQLKTMVQ